MAHELVVDIRQTGSIPLRGALRCAPGELVALVGASGAGKTSFLRAMAGLIPVTSGVVRVGEDIWCDTERRICMPVAQRHVGFVFQNYALMPHLNALENVALSLLHLSTRARLDAAAQWLDKLALTAHEQRRLPQQLSGGQQQRVALARALVRSPKVLLMDEPFSAVDYLNRKTLYRVLQELQRELSLPVVLVTHDLQEAQRLANRVVVMEHGVLSEDVPDIDQLIQQSGVA